MQPTSGQSRSVNADHVPGKPRISPLLIPLLLLMVACAYGFSLTRYGPAGFDAPLLLWFRAADDAGKLAGPDWMLAVWRTLSWLGASAPRDVLAGLTILGLLLQRRWQVASLLTGALLSGSALAPALKQWIARPRPQLVTHLDSFSSYSFPSGHALDSILFYGAVALVLATYLRRRNYRLALYATATGLSLATGVARIALGVHYPTDVLAGWIIGAAWLWLWVALAAAMWPLPRRPNAPLSPRYSPGGG